MLGLSTLTWQGAWMRGDSSRHGPELASHFTPEELHGTIFRVNVNESDEALGFVIGQVRQLRWSNLEGIVVAVATSVRYSSAVLLTRPFFASHALAWLPRYFYSEVPPWS
jgi:hypothetical protein